MDILIVYESRRGSTQRTAEALAQAAVLAGHRAQAEPMEDVAPEQVAAADALIAGCWSEAGEPLGGETTRHLLDWIESLPDLTGKRVGVYCAHSALSNLFFNGDDHPEETLEALVAQLGDRGATVRARNAFHRFSLDEEAETLIDSVVEG